MGRGTNAAREKIPSGPQHFSDFKKTPSISSYYIVNSVW